MNINTTNLIMVMTILIIAMWANGSSEKYTIQELQRNISKTGLHDNIMNLTNALPYQDIYEEEPTMRQIVINIANGMVYSLAVTINTIVPTVIWASTKTRILIYIALIYIAWSILWLIPEIVKTAIIIYFWIREKKKSKMRFYQ